MLIRDIESSNKQEICCSPTENNPLNCDIL
jgi:hypothetical protein